MARNHQYQHQYQYQFQYQFQQRQVRRPFCHSILCLIPECSEPHKRSLEWAPSTSAQRPGEYADGQACAATNCLIQGSYCSSRPFLPRAESCLRPAGALGRLVTIPLWNHERL
jgi:hypothetical protein